MSHPPINNWSQVVETVANLNPTKNKRVLDTMRKITYRSALDRQIEEHNRNLQTERMHK